MEHKHKGMIDNRRVHEDHGRKGHVQCDSMKAIKRVMQHGHDRLDYCGHDGDMSGGWKHGGTSYSKSPRHPGSEAKGHGSYGGTLTPRKG